MAVAELQLHNDALVTLFKEANAQWDDSASDFTWALLGSGYTQSDTDTTWGDVSANEISDSDYAQQAVSGLTITNNAGEAQFDSDPADFGSNVSIEAKFLVLVQGTATALAAGDKIIGTVDLDDSSSTATKISRNGAFKITPHANGFWRIAQ